MVCYAWFLSSTGLASVLGNLMSASCSASATDHCSCLLFFAVMHVRHQWYDVDTVLLFGVFTWFTANSTAKKAKKNICLLVIKVASGTLCGACSICNDKQLFAVHSCMLRPSACLVVCVGAEVACCRSVVC